MSRLLLIGLVTASMLGIWTTDAMAQRDAGAKARGDMRSFWDPSYRRSGRESFDYQSARLSADSYRSFSYEPTGVNPGDMVIVKRDGIKMMKGRNAIGTVPDGLKFKVTKVIDGWLGAVVDVEGQELRGWIWHENVMVDEEAAGESPQTERDDS